MPDKKQPKTNNSKKSSETKEGAQESTDSSEIVDNKELIESEQKKDVILDKEAEKLRSAVLNVIKKVPDENVKSASVSSEQNKNIFEHKNIAKLGLDSEKKKKTTKLFHKKTKLSSVKKEKLFSKVKILSDSLAKKKKTSTQADDVNVDRQIQEKPTKKNKKSKSNKQFSYKLPVFSFNKSGVLIFVLNLVITIILLGGISLTVIGLGMYRNTFLPSDAQSGIANLIPYPAGIVNSHVLTIAELRRDVAAMNRYFVVQADSQDFFGNIPKGDDVQSIVWDRFVQDSLLFDIADRYGLEVTNEMLQAQLDAIIEESGDFDNFKSRIALLYGWSVETFTERVIKPFVLREALSGKIFRDDKLRQSRLDLARELAKKLQENPDSFEELAREYSEDELTREDGGYLGTFKQGTLAPALNDALENLNTGEVSDVVETGEGYEIIQLLDRIPTNGSFNISARRLLIRYPTLELLLKQERERATIYRFVR